MSFTHGRQHRHPNTDYRCLGLRCVYNIPIEVPHPHCCDAFSPGREWICTLPQGHIGPHIACGGSYVAHDLLVWEEDRILYEHPGGDERSGDDEDEEDEET